MLRNVFNTFKQFVKDRKFMVLSIPYKNNHEDTFLFTDGKSIGHAELEETIKNHYRINLYKEFKDGKFLKYSQSRAYNPETLFKGWEDLKCDDCEEYKDFKDYVKARKKYKYHIKEV